MGPLGIILVVAGAVLRWAVDTNIPNVDDDALGTILLVGGVVVLALAVVDRARSRAPYVDTSGAEPGIALVVAGAVEEWALDVDIPRVDDGALGVILMLVGLLAVIVAVATAGPSIDDGPARSARLGVWLIALGAVVGWALQVDLPFVLDDALGLILVVAGVVALVLGLAGDRRLRRSRSQPPVITR